MLTPHSQRRSGRPVSPGWMAVREALVNSGDVVVVLGATGAVGSIALQSARLAGASRVIAVGRSMEKLGAIASPIDGAVELGDGYADRLRSAAVDSPTVVIDLLWGEALTATLDVLAPRARVVQVGASGGAIAAIPSAAVRGKQLRIIGYSNFGLSREEMVANYLALVDHAIAGRIDLPIARFDLAQAADAWAATTSATAKAVICFKEDDR